MKMDRSEVFVEFLLEDLEFLLRACSNSIAADEMELAMSLCEDLKFLISFLKGIPESLSDPDDQNSDNLGTYQGFSQVKIIRQEILQSYLDCVCAFAGTLGIEKPPENPSAGSSSRSSTSCGFSADRERVMLNRLTGGQKELEVINRVVVGKTRTYLSDVCEHFDILKSGTLYFDGGTKFYCRESRKMEERMCKYLKGKRYLIEVSVPGGIYYSGVWDDLKTCFPDDCNGSKILITHHCNPFMPYYPFENEGSAHYLEILPGDQLPYCIKIRGKVQLLGVEDERKLLRVKVKYMACKLFQSPGLISFGERMNSIKEKAVRIVGNRFPAAKAPERDSILGTLDTQRDIPMGAQDIIVGFDDEELALLNRLMGEKRELEGVLIAGMAGIGKTTMARRLYQSPRIIHHFHVRAWASVSQVYQKGNFLHKLLLHFEHDGEYLSQMSDETMGMMLYKCLKGKRFLIVIDDIWDAGVWNDLKMYFPNDENGSKVLLTSRIKDVVVNDNDNFPAYCLRLLREDESCYLFERKVFGSESCPQRLREMGKNIVAKCKGLPLAVVVVSGLIVKMPKTHEWWQHIAENIGPYLESDADQIMSILELSYKYLPQPLKSCFLYLGAFPEDYEICSMKLVRMWIAEGFIQQIEGKRLEDTAERYLLDLVDRSLVMVSRRRSDNGVKACCVHDTLRTLCIKKAHEADFMLPNYGYQAHSSYPFAQFDIYETGYERLFLQDFFQRDILLNFGSAPSLLVSCKEEVVLESKLLRVLDLRCKSKGHFPHEVLELVRLKYLALHVETMARLPREIFRLCNLETIILDVEKGGKVTLPQSIWTMIKLRHLQISPEFAFEPLRPSSAGPTSSSDEELCHPCPNLSIPLLLHNLQTITWLCPLGPSRDILLAKTPNVRTLGFHITLSSSEDPFNFFDISSLNVLEKLKFEYQTYGMVPVTISSPDKFPSSLKKLTLVGSHVNWEEMAIIGMLPNLEVLKVKDNFFDGPKWETCEGEFQRLKFLKFSHMDFQEWIATSDDFPSLEKLVLNGCLSLAEIPSAMGDICTLQVIEVYRSSDMVADSALQIQEAQRSWGNDEFNAFIYQNFQENTSPEAVN